MRFDGELRDAIVASQYLQLEMMSSGYNVTLSCSKAHSIYMQASKPNSGFAPLWLSIRPWDDNRFVIDNPTDDPELNGIITNFTNKYCNEA